MLLAGAQIYESWDGLSDTQHKSENLYLDDIYPYWSGIKTKFYDTGTDFTGGASYDLTASNLQDKLTNGYHFVHMATHGDTQKWYMETGITYDSDKPLLVNNNHKYSVVLTTACTTNAFDLTDPCLSEAFIRNPHGGAIAYWGSSRLGFDFMSRSQHIWGPSYEYNGQFFKNLFTGSTFDSIDSSCRYNFAAVTTLSKYQFIAQSNDYNTYRWLQFSLNAIGDPEMPIYTDNPQSFSNVSVSENGTSATVNTGVAGCTIALTSADYGVSYFNVAKEVSSYTFTNIVEPYNIVITKHNYVPYIYQSEVYIQNETISSDRYIVGKNIHVGNHVTTSKPTGDVIITNGANVIFDCKTINFDTGYETALGSSMEVRNH